MTLLEALDQTRDETLRHFDLEDRALWDDYQQAYETMLDRCSTAHAPWRVVPADKKWRRNAIVASVVRTKLEEMDPQYPKADFDLTTIEVE